MVSAYTYGSYHTASTLGASYQRFVSTASTTDVDDAYFAWETNKSVARREIIHVIPDKLPAGKRTLELPDGATLIIDDAGNYYIEDVGAKVTYQANRHREFSPHLNASDMLGRFVEYVASLGVGKREAADLPIHLFVAWLITEAASRDGDDLPADVVPVEKSALLKATLKPRCLQCGRFISRLSARRRFLFCSPEHGSLFIARHQSLIEVAP